MARQRGHCVSLRLRQQQLVVEVGAVRPTAQPAVQLTEWEVAQRTVRPPGGAEVSLETRGGLLHPL